MAKSRSIGNVYAELSVKDKMTSGLKRAEKSFAAFGKQASTAGKYAGGAMLTAGAAAAVGLAAGTKRALAMGGELTDLSANTGLAIDSLMKLRQAYTDNGKEASDVGKDIGKMQKSIYAAATAKEDPLAEFGMSAKELMHLSPEQQFFKIGAAIQAIEDPTKRTAAAMAVFGRSGASLQAVFSGADLKEIEKSLGRMPSLMADFAGGFDRADDILERLPSKSDQFFVGFSAGVIGQMLPALEQVNAKDFTTLGENLGNALSTGLEIIRSGDTWELFTLNAEKAFGKIKTFGGSAMNEVMNAWAAGINAAFDPDARTDGEGFGKFWESFDKYSEAGLEANKENVANIDARIAEIVNAAETAAKEKKDAAKVPGAPAAPEAPEVPDMPAEAPKAPDYQSTQYDVNDFQARGLGMGGETVVKEANKQITILEQIRDVLKNAKIKGKELVWET